MNYSQIFYIDPSDDTGVVKEKIKRAKREKIILVLPEENKILKNIESLTGFKVEAQKLGKKLSIFSSDPRYQKIAEDCGIEIEKSLIEDSFLKKEEVTFRPKIRDILPRKEIEKIGIEEEVKKVEKPVPKRRAKWLLGLIYALLFIFIVGGVAFTFLYLPKADITIVPAGEEIEFSGEFIAKKGAEFDLEGGIIPAILIEKEKEVEKSFLATGSEKRIDRAKGKITVYNEDSRSYNFRPETRFESPDGKIFRQPAGSDWIPIPGGSKENPGKIEINVIADEAGKEYNIGPSKFTLPGLEGSPLFNKIYGKSTEAMKGGFIGEAKVVQEEDIKKAREEMERLEENLIGEAKDEVSKEIAQDLQFLKDLILVEKKGITFDKKAGQVGETFKGRARVVAKVLSFKEENVQEIIANIIKSKVREDIEFEEVVSSLEIEYNVLKSEIDEGEMEVSFEGKEKVAWKVESAKVKKEILGKDDKGFEEYIKEDMKGKIERADLKLWPFWVSKIPEREDRVFIEIKYQ